MARDTGAWLYAVTRHIDVTRLQGITGVADEEVRTLDIADLTAVVGSVDLADFGEEPLRRNFEDATWLESTARAHDGVIAAVASVGPTLPVRLATVYRNDEHIRGLLAGRRDEFEATLRHVTGRSEWGVKVHADPRGRSATEAFNAATDEQSSRPGTAYLQRRRRQLSEEDEAEEALAAGASAIHEVLDSVAVAARRYPPQHPALTGDRRRMVLNASYLVDDESIDELTARVNSLSEKQSGFALELTGPWPPYSFAGVDDEVQ
ncbi:MAG TPA: GvpL/GvpF family gas vesicle protein [Micromonosporaceae bacterium]